MVAPPWLEQGTCRLWGQRNGPFMCRNSQKTNEFCHLKMQALSTPNPYRTSVTGPNETDMVSRRILCVFLDRTPNFYLTLLLFDGAQVWGFEVLQSARHSLALRQAVSRSGVVMMTLRPCETGRGWWPLRCWWVWKIEFCENLQKSENLKTCQAEKVVFKSEHFSFSESLWGPDCVKIDSDQF